MSGDDYRAHGQESCSRSGSVAEKCGKRRVKLSEIKWLKRVKQSPVCVRELDNYINLGRARVSPADSMVRVHHAFLLSRIN